MPVVFFPTHNDLAIFLIGGETILNGGKVYVDFVDLKFPFIYYIFAAIRFVSGGGEIPVRIVDFAIQTASAFWIFLLTKKKFRNESVGLWAGLSYSALYAGLGYAYTYSAESFFAILAAPAVYLKLFGKNKIASQILQGALIGAIIALKATFGAIVFAWLVFDALRGESLVRMAKTYLVVGISALVVFGATLAPLLDSEIAAEFALVWQYLKNYASRPEINLLFLSEFYKSLGYIFGSYFSIFLLCCFSIGLYSVYSNKDYKNGSVDLILLCAAAMLFAVFVEKKSTVIHYFRIFPFLCIIAGFGVKTAAQAFIEAFRARSEHRFALAAIALAAIIFSPAFRWANALNAPLHYFQGASAYDDYYQRDFTMTAHRAERNEIIDLVKREGSPGEKVVVSSVGAAQISLALSEFQISKFLQSCFYFSKEAPKKWREEFSAEVRAADWLVFQKNDRHGHINGHDRSSLESLDKNGELKRFVDENFNIVKDLEHYRVFKRK